MPKQSKLSSTEYRKRTAKSIEESGTIMPRKCNHCRKNGRVCKVNIRSGRCGACNEHNHRDCDVRISEAEWNRLKSQRSKVLEEIQAAREATSKALEKERRLMKQLELLDKRTDEAVAVQEADASAAEFEELLAAGTESSADLSLSPFTWSATDGIPDDFWTAPVPEGLVGGGASTVSNG